MARKDLRAALEQIRDIAEHALKGRSIVFESQSKAKPSQRATADASHARSGTLSFSLNLRAFMKKYGKGLSGPQKFALLAAHVAKGKSGHSISSDQLASEWN